MGLRAVNGIARPEQARRTWGVGDGSSVRRPDRAGSLGPGSPSPRSGRRRLASPAHVDAVLDVLAGILACYRGDLSAAQLAAQAAQSRLPDREDRVWPAIRGWVRWLHAEIGAARDDSNEVRDQVSSLWEIPGLEIASEHHVATLARRGAARGRSGLPHPGEAWGWATSHSQPRRWSSTWNECAKVASRLHQSGDLGRFLDGAVRRRVRTFRRRNGPSPLAHGRRAVGTHRSGPRPGLGSAARRRVPRRRRRQTSGSRRATSGQPARGGVGQRSPSRSALTDLVRHGRVDIEADEGTRVVGVPRSSR